ncbi:tripartite motif-containing protein 2-like [Glandiceps talaboti]
MASKELQFLKKINENFLVCTICSERYKNAKCLPCLHNFCEPCLRKLVSESGITCPICRRTYQVQDGVEGIANNTFINELLDMFSKRDGSTSSVESKTCEMCLEGERIKHCVDCGLDVCAQCVTSHRRVPAIRLHNMIPIDEYIAAKSDDPTTVQPPMYCTLHPEYKVEFYCDSCESAICLKCTALEHPRPEHKYRCVKEAASDYRKQLTDMVDKVKVKETEATDSKQTMREVATSLDECYQSEKKKMKEHIRKTIDEVSTMVQENGDTLLSEMKDEYDSRNVNLNAQIKQLEITENDLSNAREYAENLMHFGNAAQVMSAKKGVSAQMEELLKVETRTDPIENDYMEFKPCDDFCKEKSLGVVIKENYKVTFFPKFVRLNEDIVVTIATHSCQEHSTTPRMGQVDAVMKTPENTTEKVEVNDNQDGTLTLKAYARVEGEHELSVSVHKKAVHESPVRIKVIPKKGLVCQFGEGGSAVGKLNYPCGLTLTKEGNVLVCDQNNHRLQSFSQGGNHQRVFLFPGVGNEIEPYDIAVSAEGNMFITDRANKQVLVCDANGKLKRCFGKEKFKFPFGVAISPMNGRVYVGDLNGHCIHIYLQSGTFIKSFGHNGNKDGELNNPVFLSFDIKGNLFVVDFGNHRIQVFDSDGHFLYLFGREGSGDGQLKQPNAVCLDKHGYAYVTDSGNKRVLKFESDGKYVCCLHNEVKNWLRGICVTDDQPFGKVIFANGNCNHISVIAQ